MKRPREELWWHEEIVLGVILGDPTRARIAGLEAEVFPSFSGRALFLAAQRSILATPDGTDAQELREAIVGVLSRRGQLVLFAELSRGLDGIDGLCSMLTTSAQWRTAFERSVVVLRDARRAA